MNRVVMENFPEKVSFEKRLKGSEGVSQVDIWGRVFRAWRRASAETWKRQHP